MKNEIQLFNFDNQQVRTLVIDDQPYFVGKDVAEILGYRKPRNAISNHIEESDKKDAPIQGPLGGTQTMTVINESGLYDLIFDASRQSNNPDIKKRAKEFRHWVTSEVLPSIRKHGAYLTDQKAMDIITNKDALADLMQQAANQLREKDVKIERLTAELEVANKKATYVDVIIESKDDILITQIAQDYGMSAVKFNRVLHELGVQRRVNGQWVLYAKYQGQGYIASRTTSYPGKDGRIHTKVNTTWTQKGRLFLYELLKGNGILPLIEQEDK